MTQVLEVTKDQMKDETGFSHALGYTQPKQGRILILRGLAPAKRKEVLAHEEAHMAKGEEGPFLQFLLPALQAGTQLYAMNKQAKAAKRAEAERAPIVGRINALMGNSGQDAYNAELQQIQNQPGYNEEFDAGVKALETGGAASGNLFSGEMAKEKFGYGSSFLNNKVNEKLGRLNALLGIQDQTGQGYMDRADVMAAGATGLGKTIGSGADQYSYWKGGKTAMDNITGRLAKMLPKPNLNTPQMGMGDYPVMAGMG